MSRSRSSRPAASKVTASRVTASKITTLSIIIVVVLVVAITVAALIQRAREHEQLAAALSQSSFTLSESLNNPAIFTHQGVEDLATLHQSASLLNDLQTQVGSMRIYLSKASRESAMQYLDYLNRIAKKLNETSEAQGRVDQALTDYQDSIHTLRSTRSLQRGGLVQTLENKRTAVRTATELAYQETSLLLRLLEQYPYMLSLVRDKLPGTALIDPASLGTFRTALQKEMDKRNELRRQYNPAAH